MLKKYLFDPLFIIAAIAIIVCVIIWEMITEKKERPLYDYRVPIAARKGYGKPPSQWPSAWLILILIGGAVIGVYAALFALNA